ncbi:MAG: hypothetical protein WBA93_23250 [Microcoleaceae cyanobacterium]
MANLSGVQWTDISAPQGETSTNTSFRGADLTNFSAEDLNFGGADFSPFDVNRTYARVSINCVFCVISVRMLRFP